MQKKNIVYPKINFSCLLFYVKFIYKNINRINLKKPANVILIYV